MGLQPAVWRPISELPPLACTPCNPQTFRMQRHLSLLPGLAAAALLSCSLAHAETLTQVQQRARDAALAAQLAVKLAEDHKMGRVPRPKLGFQTLFEAGTVRPYLETLVRMEAAIKPVSNPQQAAGFVNALKNELPRLASEHQRFSYALLHRGDAVNNGTTTPPMAEAEALLPEIANRSASIEAEMQRVEKFYPAATETFARVRAMGE